MSRLGLEPRTLSLKGRCSTTELAARANRERRPPGDAALHHSRIAERVSINPAYFSITISWPASPLRTHNTCDSVRYGAEKYAYSLRSGFLSAPAVMSLYDVRAMNEDITRLGDLSAKCCERVQHAVSLLPKLSDHATAAAAIKTCEEIDRLESDADRVMRSAMSKLFREENDVRELIKLKTIYEQLESISDRCEDVANLIEGVVLENS